MKTQEKKGLNLKEYSGEDKILSSHELKLLLDQETSSWISVKSRMPTLDRYTEGFRDGELIVISGPTKNGKCMKKGTLLLMFDGSIKPIELIAVGDKLMGDDSRPRIVLSVCRGYDKLFKIIPWQGEPYSINQDHILCLQRTKTNKTRKDDRLPDRLAGSVLEVSLKDYFSLSKYKKHILKTYRVPVKFPAKKFPVDPYFLGLWLGDGNSHEIAITTSDNEIIEYLKQFAQGLGLDVSIKIQPNNKSKVYRLKEPKGYQKGRKGRVPLKTRLQKIFLSLDLFRNKHIPYVYKCNSEENRLKLLAGLIDTDGSNTKSTRGGAIEFYSKYQKLSEDVTYLCRSLGFSCTLSKVKKKIKSIGFEGEYWRIRIGGDISQIPCRIKRKTKNGMAPFKNILRSSFYVEKDGCGEYFGFTLSGNGRYLLSDFQVTHNTLLAQTLTMAFCRQQEFPLWFSFEVPTRQFLNQFPELPLFYLPTKLRAHVLPWIETRIMESFAKFRTRIVFIDHLHYVFDMARAKSPSIEIGTVIRKLKTLAVQNGFLVFLLCHTTKGKVDDDFSYDSIRDSSFVSQESDCVLMIKRCPKTADNAAEISVEFHRRTGILEKIVNVHKENGFLVETQKEE